MTGGTIDRTGDTRLFIRGIGSWLPQTREAVEKAVAAGSYGRDRAVKDGFSSVAVEHELFPADMGVEAARRALEGVDRSEVDWLAWTSIHRTGHKTLWPIASYAHHQLGLDPRALSFSLNQGCNGAFVGMRLAADHVRHHPDASALVVGADRFEGSLFDRWSSDHGTVYGDAASAVVLSSRPGPIEVLLLEVEQGSELERMYRDESPAPEDADNPGRDYDVGSAKRAYLERFGDSEIRSVFADTLGRLREKLLARYPLDHHPARYVVYPNVGAGISAGFYENSFGDLAQANAWDYGRAIGHTGVSDQVLGLADLVHRELLAPGDRVLLIGAGNGLSAAVMLVEISSD
ncbi:ketoacyl-ACP synthase III family protein [Streptomyces sp. NPDC049954]|uniref:ketoacyl-ACP synthase III family protein n=1 Tax=Streptomyces sp. NPDC049954 TaxID=3155779 RepID=UPI00343825AB